MTSTKPTREQILSATPEQLDEWTAVWVMGWSQESVDAVRDMGPRYRFRPTNSWSDLGEVVGKMRGDGWNYRLDIFDSGTAASFDTCTATGNTPLIATTRAACLAKVGD